VLVPDVIDFEKNVDIFKLEKNLFDITDFKCSNPEYESYIKDDAYKDQTKFIAQTWVFVHKNENVIGYVSIAMGDLNKIQHKKLNHFPHTNVPGLLLGRIATRKEWEKHDVGQTMVEWVFSEAIRYSTDVGCRILYLNPEDGVDTWYSEKMKFVPIKNKHGKVVTMFHDLQKYLNQSS